MNQPEPQDGVHICPYCGRPLLWVPHRWFGRGTFECEQCGDFPDLAEVTPASERPASALIDPPVLKLARKRDGRPRVLLVDDSIEHRDLYALMLEPTATVVTASRGEDALMIAAAQPLDAIVLDIMMPGMDGWQACERLKANPLTSGIPVILLTSLDGLEVPARAERVGATAVLIKPCPVERLAIAIEAAVQRRFGGPRRWRRKPLRTALTIRVGELPAHMLNISYGGLCVDVERLPDTLPSSVDIMVPMVHVAIQADVVWTSRSEEESWLCGAQIAQVNDAWRTLVDAIS